jgi:hypothetical protein
LNFTSSRFWKLRVKLKDLSFEMNATLLRIWAKYDGTFESKYKLSLMKVPRFCYHFLLLKKNKSNFFIKWKQPSCLFSCFLIRSSSEMGILVWNEESANSSK